MSWITKCQSWLNTALFAAPLCLVLYFGGVPCRVSKTDTIILSPVTCPHGASGLIVDVRDPKDPCHVNKLITEPKEKI